MLATIICHAQASGIEVKGRGFGFTQDRETRNHMKIIQPVDSFKKNTIKLTRAGEAGATRKGSPEDALLGRS